MAAYSEVYDLEHELEQHYETLSQARDQFAGVSDGLARHNGVLGAQTYASAHEAVLEIARLAVLVLVLPKIDDRAKWRAAADRQLTERWEEVTLSPTASSALRACIRQERAKVILHEQRNDLPNTGMPEADESLSLDERALAVFIANPTFTKTKIAKRLSLRNAQSLAPKRCPKLHAAMCAYKAPALPKGSKRADGTIEAWENE